MRLMEDALKRVPGLRKGHCTVCDEETLWAAFCARHGDNCLVKHEAPKTCGRLKCMIATGEQGEVS